MNENTYIKLQVHPTGNLEYHINDLLGKRYFPRYDYRLNYLAKFSKITNGEEEVFKRCVKSDVHNTLMQKLDDERLGGSIFVFQEIEEDILEEY